MKRSGAGALSERLAFEARLAIDDGYGNTVAGDYAVQFNAAARITPLKGGEAVIADRLQGTQPYVLTIRYCDAAKLLKPEWRARNLRTGAIYEIKSIANPDEKRKYMAIVAIDGVAG